jgi:hypothetical protein
MDWKMAVTTESFSARQKQAVFLTDELFGIILK